MNLLERYKTNDSVSIKSKDGLHIIKYKNLGVDWENEEIRNARGLILNDNGEVVARPFTKFFNLHELIGRENLSLEVQNLSREDDGPIEVTDKRDGSMVIAFYNNGLKFASSGALESEHADMFHNASKRLRSKDTYGKIEELSKTYTILLEYTSPDNRVVLEYDEEKLILIGLIETKTGIDHTMKEIKEITYGFGVEYVEVLTMSNLAQVLEYIENTKDIEGVVVLFTDTMKRIKIKTEDYFTKHKISNGFTLKTTGLTSANILSIEQYILNQEEGDLDDLLSKYRNKDVFNGTLVEVDILKKQLNQFMKDLYEVSFKYEKFYDVTKQKNFRDIMNVEEFIDGIPIQLLVLINIEIHKFWKAQEDYELIKKTLKSTVFKKLIVTINKEVGEVSKYSNKIGFKSFIHNVVDKKQLWNMTRSLGAYI